jgi:hypothetical protein
VLVEVLDKLVAPGGLVGALEQVILGLCIVAPDAFIVGCGPYRAHALSSWQPAVSEARGEELEASVAPAGCSVRVKVDLVEGCFVPFVAFLHVLLDLLAGDYFAQSASFVS